MQLTLLELIEQLGTTAEQLQHNQVGGLLLLGLLMVVVTLILGTGRMFHSRRRED
ncbi:hypothetical protein [Pseudoduganella sp. R-34]|uniref:hypothetical protein n=1 Tax=Pseudoduganella sp. R-34 TaxID=3404062 RepID=UPI003CE7A943